MNNFLSIYDVLDWIDSNIVWGIPLLALILVVGIVMTMSLKQCGSCIRQM